MDHLEEKTYPFEIKAVTEEGTFEGYAAIFGKPDAFGEVIEKGGAPVILESVIGSRRILDMIHSEQLPRIC